MKIYISAQMIDSEEVLINGKGCEEVEIDPWNDIQILSLERKNRFIGLNGKLYRMTNKSYKELKKDLMKKNQLFRFDYSKR